MPTQNAGTRTDATLGSHLKEGVLDPGEGPLACVPEAVPACTGASKSSLREDKRRSLRFVLWQAEGCIARAGHEACGLSRLQHRLMLEQIGTVYPGLD